MGILEMIKPGKKLERAEKSALEQEGGQQLEWLLKEYKNNQNRLILLSNSYIGKGHQIDRSHRGAIEHGSADLRKKIIDLAQKLGRDGNSLIIEVDEDVQRGEEKKRAA